jgi:hypothetical protein
MYKQGARKQRGLFNPQSQTTTKKKTLLITRLSTKSRLQEPLDGLEGLIPNLRI